jgi:hypothetical protein
VAVEAVAAGLEGTAGRNAVTRIPTPISGIDGVNNSDAIVTGAADAETNDELTVRIRSTKTSKNLIGTRTGYQEIINALTINTLDKRHKLYSSSKFGIIYCKPNLTCCQDH